MSADHDKDAGILKWEIGLQPAEEKIFQMRYVVTHPKNAAVRLD